MKIADFPVPPIVRAVTVGFVPMQAFAVFVEDFARWWPLTRVHTGLDPVECAIEPWSGGRVFERPADGRETLWGTLLAYDPPHRLAFSRVVELPAGLEQLMEIRFTAEDRGTTVELTHSGWEQLGDAAASLRERYDRGWGTVFEHHFADYANSAAT
jgi:uncharacterized protein YndB with AHSA1/START domain